MGVGGGGWGRRWGWVGVEIIRLKANTQFGWTSLLEMELSLATEILWSSSKQGGGGSGRGLSFIESTYNRFLFMPVFIGHKLSTYTLKHEKL